MALDKARLKMMRDEINTALGAVRANNPGVTLRVGNCSFTPDGSFTFKLEGIAEGGKSADASRYETVAQWDKELPPLGAKFTQSGREFEVIGMPSRGDKIHARDTAAGKVFVFKRDSLVALYSYQMGRQKAADAARK